MLALQQTSSFSSGTDDSTAYGKPVFPLPFLEPFRAVGEFFAQFPLNYLTDELPDGDGHPVLVVPGFLCSDATSIVMRNFLERKGYRAFGWNLGRNHGPTASGENGQFVDERIREIVNECGRTVSLLGFSLGGTMVRNAARRQPELIRQVITLGSPFDTQHGASSIEGLFKLITGMKDKDIEELDKIMDYNRPPPHECTPCTSIFSKTDGVVHWKTCIEKPASNTDNIEVLSSHFGMMAHPFIFYLLAERLSVNPDNWTPFDRTSSAWRRLAFPSSGFYDF